MHLFFPGYIRFKRYPSVYSLGETNVSFVCENWFFTEIKNVSLEIQLRRNANDNWTSVVEFNRSSVFRKRENTFFSFTILSVREEHYQQYYQQVTLTGLVQSEQCTVDPKISPDFRCVLSDESRIMDSSETKKLSIEGLLVGSCILENITNKCMYIFTKNQIMTGVTRNKNAFNFRSRNETR